MRRGTIMTSCCLVAAIIFVIKVYTSPFKDGTIRFLSDQEQIAIRQTLIKQRNELAQQLNLKQQRVGQLVCEQMGKGKQTTSETGGWCQNTSKENSGTHKTDIHLANALADFFKAKRVASFGDGPGRYKQLIGDSGKVRSYDAYDGAPFCDTTSEGRVQFLDLSLKQFGLPVYDWVLSLEVAEHIPAMYEHTYLDNIFRHAREGVVISWAVPGQGGYNHVNNRPFTYVIKVMDDFGFSHEKKESEKLQNEATFSYLKNNINVFRRREFYKFDNDSQYFT